MLGATMYIAGKEADTKELIPDASSCAMCKRLIINAGIDKVVIRNSKNAYSVVDVQTWIDNDESLTDELGY